MTLNQGPFVVDHSLPFLIEHIDSSSRVVLPICSVGTPMTVLAELGELVLPPLYREAMDGALRGAIIDRVRQCFPYHVSSARRRMCDPKLDVVEVSETAAREPTRYQPAVLMVSIDTAVEEHGPHLPLATDRIQSYAVLERVAAQREDILIASPADYGQLTWALGPGMSIDLPALLTTAYVTGYVNALIDWASPAAVYVVDVHGSIIHRATVEKGVAASRAKRWAFRWLHEPISAFTLGHKDAHAGGAETKLIETIDPAWIDPAWWPGRIDDLSAHQMSLTDAIALGGNVDGFIERAERSNWNGIVGDINTYANLDGEALMQAIVDQANADVNQLG